MPKRAQQPAAIEELILHCDPTSARRWRQALHAGFHFRIPGGLSVRELLSTDLGMDSDYVENRVRTVFLGGRPVDDIDEARVGTGMEMTLSTMLPGVAGITMGRGNMIAAYRADITYHEEGTGPAGGQALIFIKLLNFIATETGHTFLSRGIGLDATAWNRMAAPAIWEDVSSATLDGVDLDNDALLELAPPGDGVVRFVTLKCGPGDA